MDHNITLEDAALQLSAWLRSNPKDAASQKAALDHYGTYFHPDSLQNITAEGFKAFLLIRNNRHWSGINRQPNIYADMDRLRKALRILLDETRPIQNRLDQI